jgi:hypothetical protein
MTHPKREASRETLERLARALDTHHLDAPVSGDRMLMDALTAWRAEIAPRLRTRADVDAEIATICRVAYGAGNIAVVSGAVNMSNRIEKLCAEPTAPEAETLVDCDVCDGKGETHDCSCAYPHRCYRCGGRGKLLRT